MVDFGAMKSVSSVKQALSAIEWRHSSSPDASIVAAAFALYAARKAKPDSSGDRLPELLKKAGASQRVVHFVERKIGDHWEEYSSLLSSFSEEELADFFATSRLDAATLRTPPSLAALVLRLFELRADDSVLDLGSGSGDFLKAAWFALWDKAGSDESLSVTGVELDSDRVALSEIRALTDGMRPTLVEANVFDRAAVLGVQRSAARGGGFSKVFTLPPLGARARDIGLGRIADCLQHDFPGFPAPSAGPADWFFAARAAAVAAPGGRAIALLPEGALFGRSGTACRRYLLGAGRIECVVALPQRLFPTTNIRSALVIFGRGAESVRFVDATDLFVPGRRQNAISPDQIEEIARLVFSGEDLSPRAKSVGVREILAGDCDLRPARVLSPVETLADSVPFRAALSSLRRGGALESSELDALASREETQFLYLAPGDIQDGVVADRLPFLKEIPRHVVGSCAQDGDLLLSRLGPPFKVAVAEVPVGKVLLPGGNLFVARPDPSKADPWYLKAFFDSPAGAGLLARCSPGKTVKSLPLRSLEELPVPLPSIDEQRVVAARAKRAHADVKAARAQLGTALGRLRGAFASPI